MARKSVQEERRQQIMDALYECMLKKQFHEITIKDIAQSAGMNHGMIYYFYQSKEDVLMHFIDRIGRLYRREYELVIAKNTDSGASPREMLERAFEFSNTRIILNKELSKIFIEIWAIANHNKKVRKKLQGLFQQWEDEIMAILLDCGIGKKRAQRISTAMVSFFEGTALISIVFDQKNNDIILILKEFQEKILGMLEAKSP